MLVNVMKAIAVASSALLQNDFTDLQHAANSVLYLISVSIW